MTSYFEPYVIIRFVSQFIQELNLVWYMKDSTGNQEHDWSVSWFFLSTSEVGRVYLSMFDGVFRWATKCCLYVNIGIII